MVSASVRGSGFNSSATCGATSAASSTLGSGVGVGLACTVIPLPGPLKDKRQHLAVNAAGSR